MPPRVVREDIPVARRSTRAGLPRSNSLRPVIGTTLVLITTATALGILFRDPLRRLLAPPPVAGLNARQGADGRLLGHFPYNEVPAEQLVEVAPGLKLQRDAAEALLAMQRAAAVEGVDLRLLSAFRPVRLQKAIFFDVKAERNQSADERARVSAPPGFSEHSTGYAVDLGDGRLPAANLAEPFEDTPAFRWLQRNANRFHFQLSFPRSNRQGVSYEPWHWRFEGSAEALRLFEPARQLAGSR
jgi:D-alanyl-D-alanine carboxypeptidase